MARGRPLPTLELTEEEREQLQTWARGRKTSQALALRSRIVLSCAEAQCNHEVARRFQVTPQTVGKWRTRFLQRRLAGLTDEPRPGAPRKMTDGAVAVLVTTVMSCASSGGHRWSSRALAAKLGMSQSTVSRVLKSLGVQSRASDAFRLSSNPHYIEQVRDIVGLYIDSPLRAIVLCVDETHPSQPPGTAVRWPPAGTVLPARHALDYPRYEDRTLFEALNHATCGTLGNSARGAGLNHFLAFLHELDAAVPAERGVHVVIDEKGRRKRPSIDQWFARKPRFRLLVAPTCDAWLSQVERWFALLVQRQARAGQDDPGAAALEDAVRRFLDSAGAGPFSWVKSLARHS